MYPHCSELVHLTKLETVCMKNARWFGLLHMGYTSTKRLILVHGLDTQCKHCLSKDFRALIILCGEPATIPALYHKFFGLDLSWQAWLRVTAGLELTVVRGVSRGGYSPSLTLKCSGHPFVVIELALWEVKNNSRKEMVVLPRGASQQQSWGGEGRY